MVREFLDSVIALACGPSWHVGSDSRPRLSRPAAMLLGSCVLLLGASLFAPSEAAAETIKIGMLKIAGAAPFYLAKDKGYFAAEGLDADLVFFDSGSPVTVAVVSGDLDFGAVGATASFYNLAAQGSVRIIAGLAREVPGFRTLAWVVSNRAAAAGLTSFKDLAGHSVGVSQIGSGSHYSVALIAEKYGLDLKSIRILPLQSITNELSSVAGGQVDAAVITSTPATAAIQRGDMKLLGYVGEQTPWQIGAVYASTKTLDQRPDMIKRFLRAFDKGMADYRAAFVGPGEKPIDGPTAPAVLAIISKYTGQPADRIKLAIPDIDSRLDVKDIMHQIAWFKSQGMVKGDIKINQVIDKRYAVAVAGQ